MRSLNNVLKVYRERRGRDQAAREAWADAQLQVAWERSVEREKRIAKLPARKRGSDETHDSH